MLGAFVCVDLYFLGCELLTSAFPGGSGAEVVSTLVAGPVAPFFWGEVLCCAAAAVICFVPRLRTAPGIVAASVLAIAGIFCKRAELLVGGFQSPNIAMPGVMTGHTVTNWAAGWQGAYEGLVYWPEPIELGVMVGVLALGGLVLLLGLRYLPLAPASAEE